MQRETLLQILNTLLKPKLFKDYTINGLQVAGKSQIQTIMTAVSASQAAIAAAAAQGADALLVHHGYFWKGEDSAITGIKRERLKTLLENDINLIAYHLPLDQHAELGNNILFGRALGTENIRQSSSIDLIWHGELPALTPEAFTQRLHDVLQRSPQAVGSMSERISRIAWCTGAAQDFLAQAADEGAQAFLSGEYAERTYHEANELGIAYFSCGHHATERFGIRALGRWLMDNHRINTLFFDEPNPF